MKKLTKKTYLLFAALSVTACTVAYICICMFLPYINNKHTQHNLDVKAKELVIQLRSTRKDDSESLFMNFITQTGAEVCLKDSENQPVSMFTFKNTDNNSVHGSEFPFRFNDSQDEYILVAAANHYRSDEVHHAVVSSIPFVAVIIILQSVLAAWIFSRYTTRPIMRINNIAKKMASLDFSWYCPDIRDDEIGMLSQSINGMSDKCPSQAKL